MLNIKRWFILLLDLSLMFSIVPIDCFAQGTHNETHVDFDTNTIMPVVVPEADDPEVIDTTPDVNTQSQETTVTDTPVETQNEEGQVVSLAEPQTIVTSFSDAFANAFASQLITYGIATESNIGNYIIESGSDHTLKVGADSRILVLLSQMEQTVVSNYCRWTIDFDITGLSLDVTLDVPNSIDKLTYIGLGDADYPFAGKFTGNIGSISSKNTIFKAVSTGLTIQQSGSNYVGISWNGSKDIPILANKVVADSASPSLNMPLISSSTFSPYIGELVGNTGQVTIESLNYSDARNTYQDGETINGNLGLVCNHMEANTSLKISQITLNNQADLRGSDDVGGLVGKMDSGSVLTIGDDLNLNVKTQGTIAGGIIGYSAGGSVVIEADKNVTVNATVSGQSAGGIAGKLESSSGLITGNGNLTLNSISVTGSNNAGGLYGECSITSEFYPLSKLTVVIPEISGTGNCGGLFGLITLNENGKIIIRGTEQNNLVVNSTLKGAGNNTVYGGIAGNISGNRSNVLVVDYAKVTATIDVDTEASNYPKYLGGIVGKQIGSTVDIKYCDITVNNPTTKNASDYGFGGVTAYLDDNTLLISDKIKINTDSYTNNPGGGGVVGSAHKGSVVYLKTSLDLSECQISTNATSGQIVGSQDCSLIYAPTVAITRLQTGTYSGMELDDIGNYGELYRIQNFITVYENSYEITFHSITGSNNEYSIGSSIDYASIALAWQSRGIFPTVDGINTGNWATLKSSTININSVINLTNCGIGGLTRDVYSSDDMFSGILNGKNHSLILGIGEENQANSTKVTKGDGRIYWHDSTGLFAGISASAEVKNITLSGTVRLSNNKKSPMYSGGLSAQIKGVDTSDTSVVSNVSTEVTYDVNSNGANVLYVGGLIGFISDKQTEIVFDDVSRINPKISISYTGNGSANHFGSAIGGIENNASADITCNGVTIGGKINQTGSNPNNMYAGGLVGTIWPSDKTRNITILNLTVNGFTLEGNASERMGGILGSIWADTDVTISGLSVTNSNLKANGTSALGGLVYRANGKWTVNSIDLSGLSIQADSSKGLGLLVCHGDPHKDPINGSNKNMNGLYLEMAEHWDWNPTTKKGYVVPSNITFDSVIFDEFVAYTAYADRASDTPNYQITSNGSGIISLKTNNDTVNMKNGDRNTYVNRTTVGQRYQTNLYSRYYYNLSTVQNACNGADIDTANELLVWSVYRYAADNLKKYFEIDNVSRSTIGGSSVSPASFDMKGLSYYPIDIVNSSITVQYANVTFYNSSIESKEAGNKFTTGNSESHSQHYTMHCALFMNFTSDLKNLSSTAEKNKIMTVNGVSFSGTIGVVNGGSGAIVCGNVSGETREGNTAVYTVVLSNADNEQNGVFLNGISVDPAGDYTPVLINNIGSYAGLKANFITTTGQQTMIAGSSLIGNVGGEGATGITVSFSGTIKLTESGVFSKAILLNSIRYNSGSATYNFYKSKDYDGDTYVHYATYGKELNTTVEFAGKQGCYYDGYGAGFFISVNKNFDDQNDFTSYLPYVAFSPATGDKTHTLAYGWHELAVNVLSADIVDGCGTYGHPYKVNGNLLKQAADYINTGVASNGWQVRIAITNTYHNGGGENDVILTYTEEGWKNGETLSNVDVRKYLQSAYYVITENIELANFSGIGTDKEYAFKGVITGKRDDGSISIVTMKGGSTSFIQYSYGSVIRDLNFNLYQSPTLNRPSWTRGTAEQAPSTFFGGVIGCVLGGDNIIDNVTVSSDVDFNVTPGGINAHLVPVGGYIGVIAGGGVVFRGTVSSNTGITGTGTQLYRNPIIGRVLDGFAFYEGDNAAPDNTDKNYKINKLNNSTDDLNWNGTELIVNNAQGLLVLSAIVSSGAGSSVSYAYANGVARNAAYNHIGEVSESSDYSVAKKDSSVVWTNEQTPYLLNKYASYHGNVSICTSATTGITMSFVENATFNMLDYANGYRGLSARYVSNASFSTSTTLENKTIESSDVDASTVVMRVNTFNGNGTTVQNINMDVKEYDNDDFHAASIGGIFNIVWTSQKSGGGGDGSNFAQNLTLQNCNVSLKYWNSSGVEQNLADSNTLSDADGRYSVSVGGFIGMANDVYPTQNSINHNYLFTNIHIVGSAGNTCRIYGPNGVGGLIGTTAMTSTGVTGYPGILLANRMWALLGPNFVNCSFNNIEVSAGAAAGGLIGDAYASGSTTVPGFSGLGISYSNGFNCYASYTVTSPTLIVGNNSTITARAKASIAGGIFGAAGMRVGVNDPDVGSNNKTNLTISGARQVLQLSRVNVYVSQDSYNGSNPDSGENNAYAGGIIARIGSVNSVCFYDISMKNCVISSSYATASYVGGIVGSGYTNTTDIMQRCTLTGMTIEGAYAGGFLGRGLAASGFELHMSDCKLSDSSINGQQGKTSYAGGIVGNAASKYYLSNILIKNASITARTGAGQLFGYLNINKTGNDLYVQAAGISIYSDSETVNIPNSYYGSRNREFDYIGYIAYCDYSANETSINGNNAPYVTVNPNYQLTAEKTLFGDAVGKLQDDTYSSVAARIWADNKNGATNKKNLATYSNAQTIVNSVGKNEPEISTFNAVQGVGPDDLPVLTIKGGDATVIEDYLNVITNGGYSKAKSISNALSLSVSVYAFEEGVFVEKDKAELDNAKAPASIYLDNNEIKILGNSYDNTRNRFSLVEATFRTTVNNRSRTYTVSVPVVVIRELQYDFMATLTYGAEFQKSTYSTLTNHVLESAGNPITAYLTYSYNREKGEYVPYDWQSYMESGGNMFSIDKKLKFTNGLPKGTQLILVDCQDGNRAYQYKVGDGGITDVQLSAFTAVTSAEHFDSSMADILGVTVSPNLTGGEFVTTDDDSLATVKLNGQYYRLYEDGVIGDRCDLTVPDLEENNPRENYYLLIYVPEQTGSEYFLNGNIKSELVWNMPNSGIQVHRYNESIIDPVSDSESTYQIYSGYQQSLESLIQGGEAINLLDANKKMQVAFKDTITFSSKQAYGDEDPLFAKFNVSLRKYTNNSALPEDLQFAVGTSGTVYFYIQDSAGQYYTFNGTSWSTVASEKEAASYEWVSQGNNMELLLSMNGKEALDLAGVRQIIKKNNALQSEIIITAKMDVKFNDQDVINATVPASDQSGTDVWAQLHYAAILSAQASSLSYSSNRLAINDNAHYYRSVKYAAVLSLDAALIDQLGVNPLEPVEDYMTFFDGKESSHIELNAALDLKNLPDYENTLKNTKEIRFSLSLEKRNGGDNYTGIENASNLIGFKWKDGSQGWNWNILQNQFVENGEIKESELYTDGRFSFPLDAYVSVEPRDFANYKIKLTISFIGEDDATLSLVVDDSDAYVVYTYACIKPTFYSFSASN